MAVRGSMAGTKITPKAIMCRLLLPEARLRGTRAAKDFEISATWRSEQMVFMAVLTIICSVAWWCIMWIVAERHNRQYLRFLIEQLEGGSDGKEEENESAQV